MRLLFVFSALLILTTSIAKAEYRAFLLKISSPGSPDFRLVKSSLDPSQYPGYYPLRQGEQIQYIDTWMCRGRTNEDADICPSPRASPQEVPPATEGEAAPAAVPVPVDKG